MGQWDPQDDLIISISYAYGVSAELAGQQKKLKKIKKKWRVVLLLKKGEIRAINYQLFIYKDIE